MNFNGIEKWFKTENGEIVDFNQKDICDKTPTIHILQTNKVFKLKLNTAQIDYLLKNSDMKHIDKYGRNIFMYALRNNKEQRLKLTKNHFDYLIKNSDMKHVNNDG